MRSRRTPDGSCKTCRGPTSEGKPYCIEHLTKLPYAKAVAEEIARRDDEETGVRPLRPERINEVREALGDDGLLLSEFAEAVSPIRGVIPRELARAFEKHGTVRLRPWLDKRGHRRLRVVVA